MKEYDPDQLDIIFSLVPLSGFGPDTMIELSEDGPRFTTVVGVDGDVTRTKVRGVLGKIKVSLMQSSQSNAVLSGIHALDTKTPGGAGVGPFLFRDRNGVSVFAAEKCWIDGMPTAGKGKAAGTNVWSFTCTNYEYFEGGSADI